MDLNQELVQRKDRPVGETVLAKIEWGILNDTMPPAKFAVVHWGSRLSDQDKKDILTWVAQTRKAHYATDAAPEHANEPIQPLPHRLPVDEAKVALGKTLFNDARLSADSTVACATCHAMDNARFSEGIRKQLGDVNAPTTFNAVFNFVQFWGGRAADLQEQAGGLPLPPIEMGSKDWDEIVARLAADAELTAKFRAVYPDGWSGKNITDAIAEYEKTLISPDSRFDRWLRGAKSALTAAEVEGCPVCERTRQQEFVLFFRTAGKRIQQQARRPPFHALAAMLCSSQTPAGAPAMSVPRSSSRDGMGPECASIFTIKFFSHSLCCKSM